MTRKVTRPESKAKTTSIFDGIPGKRSDVRLLTRALREKWEVPVEAFKDAPQVMLDIVNDVEEKGPTRVAAAKALCDMTGKNLDAIVAVMELRILTGDDFDDDYDIEEDEAFFGNDAHAKDTIKQREAAIVGDPQDKKAKTSKAAKSSKKSSG